VRVPGSPPEITFGRLAGPAFRHVQIESLLVSRRHATLLFANGVWTLRNESATNPTVLNGKPLGPGTAEAELRHGDQIEMGDVAFVLHHQTRERVAGLARS
jgi:predicted component of type VI protein secretion system